MGDQVVAGLSDVLQYLLWSLQLFVHQKDVDFDLLESAIILNILLDVVICRKS